MTVDCKPIITVSRNILKLSKSGQETCKMNTNFDDLQPSNQLYS